ncbi:MAG: P-II family nitrogen regulator [Endomicrobia bacterium]|nr:P-II family nitrogen regulator [Endomicrobiia bacterium]
MIKIEAIVREEKFEDIKEALCKINVCGITVSEVQGCGKQKGYTKYVRGTEVNVNLLKKIKFEIIVSSPEWEQKTISAISEAAYTGNPGDGKIFSYDLREVVRVRTKETGIAAIN